MRYFGIYKSNKSYLVFLILLFTVFNCKTTDKLKSDHNASKELELVFTKSENENSETEKKVDLENNPFCPQTEIMFETNHLGNVLVKIYNNKGKFIIERLFSEINPGKQVIQLKNLEILESGLYIYQIFLNDIKIEQKKMIVLK